MMKALACSLLLLCFDLLACPNCAGSGSGKDKYTYLILGGFIVLCYIPFYLMYHIAKKDGPQLVKGNADDAENR